jgi:rod shape determining protein RodA
LFKKQLIWYGGGLGVMVFCFLFDYKQFERFANFIYMASVGSLTAVLFFGKYVGGSRRWLPLGTFFHTALRNGQGCRYHRTGPLLCQAYQY